MADIREQILSRLVTVCEGITGIAAATRNRLDVAGLARPAIILRGGNEDRMSDAPGYSRRYRFMQAPQWMELHPIIELRLRADNGAEAGELVSLFRGRIVNAICGDATLQSYIGDGDIWLESFSEAEPTPESQEPRANFEFAFRYRLMRGELTA